jgi:hypothetical protein
MVRAVVAVVLLIGLLVLRRHLGDRRIDLSALTVLFAPVNRIRFYFRRRLAFSRGTPVLEHESKDEALVYLEGSARKKAEREIDRLILRYPKGAPEMGPVSAYRECLYVLACLDAYALVHVPKVQRVRVVDVGSKDFVYASALAAFARRAASATHVELTGVEIDGNVIYDDLFTRADHGRAHAALSHAQAVYEVADFLAFRAKKPVHLVTFFYPFVTRFALLRWGLPASELRPEELFAHAVDMLDDNGILLVVNHTHEERDLLRAMLDKVTELALVDGGPLTSNLVDYYEDVPERFASVYRRRERASGC